MESVESPSSFGNQPRVVVVDSVEVIDLSADDNELQTDEEPQWCPNLVKTSEECVPATPPHLITEEDTPKEIHCSEDRKSDIEQMTTSTETEKQITNEEIETKTIESPALEVKISNVRRTSMYSDSTDLSFPDTLSKITTEDSSHDYLEITSTSHSVQEVPTEKSCSNNLDQSKQEIRLPIKKQMAMPAPILPTEVPFWHKIDSSEPLQKFDHSQACSNLLVNINLDPEIRLPMKKRRVSSFAVEIKDELSYPATPMISIAELENIESNKMRNHRPFKTPAELKEVPPIQPSCMYNTNNIPPMTTVTDIYNISHTYSTTPTINHHVTSDPTIISTPLYQLPSMQPIVLPVNRAPKTN